MDAKTLPNKPPDDINRDALAPAIRRRISSRPVRSASPRLPSASNFRRSTPGAGRNFKANRRGYWSLWIFLVLFIVSLFAEFIANDKPLFIHFDGKNYFPVFFTYPDTEFGDDLGTAADYRDPYMQKFLDEHNAIEIWPPIRFSYKTINDRPPSAFPSKPTWLLNKADCDFAAKNGYAQCGTLEMNWLGTDDQGRDVLARMIYGFRISVLFGLVLTIVSSIIGIAAGAVQGYFGGWTDLVVPALHRNLDFGAGALSAPDHLFGAGARLLRAAWASCCCSHGCGSSGLVRAEFLRGRNFEYIQAARALGVSNKVIMFRHLLPNAMVATMTFLPFIMSSSVMTLTALDFLGFGLPPGSPSLGELLSQGKANVQAPWLGLTGFFTVALMLSLLIFIGEAVRDAFDPRKTFT